MGKAQIAILNNSDMTMVKDSLHNSFLTFFRPSLTSLSAGGNFSWDHVENELKFLSFLQMNDKNMIVGQKFKFPKKIYKSFFFFFKTLSVFVELFPS